MRSKQSRCLLQLQLEGILFPNMLPAQLANICDWLILKGSLSPQIYTGRNRAVRTTGSEGINGRTLPVWQMRVMDTHEPLKEQNQGLWRTVRGQEGPQDNTGWTDGLTPTLTTARLWASRWLPAGPDGLCILSAMLLLLFHFVMVLCFYSTTVRVRVAWAACLLVYSLLECKEVFWWECFAYHLAIPLPADRNWSCLTWGGSVRDDKKRLLADIWMRGAYCGRHPLNYSLSLPWWECLSWTCGWPAGTTFPFSPIARDGYMTKCELIGYMWKLRCASMWSWPQSTIVLQLLFPLPAGKSTDGTQLPTLDMDKRYLVDGRSMRWKEPESIHEQRCPPV